MSKRKPKKNRRKTEKKKSRYGRKIFFMFKWMIILSIIGIIMASGVGYSLYRHFSEELPKIKNLNDYRPATITNVYSDNGKKIGEFYQERRIVAKLDEMPDMLIKAFVAAEDSRFFSHKGVDLKSIIRAAIKNYRARAVVQGGSTITQQVTKSFLLTPEKSYTRKAKEAILAFRIEKSFSKQEILFLYMNQIYLGHGSYGVASAAENYYGKKIKDINLAECAMLAGLPQAPSEYSPFRHFKKAKARQVYVLRRMKEEGYITPEQVKEAVSTKLDIQPRRNWYQEQVPYFTEYVRQYVEKKYGRDTLFREGLQIYTTVDIEIQKLASKAIDNGLRELDKRQGFRGPVKNIPKDQIESFSKDIIAKITKDPLKPDKITRGVVIDVNDKKKRVLVRIGNERGRILLKNMRWARKPNYRVSYKYSKIKRPSRALKIGDVIDVKVIAKVKDKDLWDLSLEQTPEVQSALLCIENGTGRVKAMVGGSNFKRSQFNRAIQSRRQPGSAFKPIIYAAALDQGFTPATEIIDNAIVHQMEDSNKIYRPKNYDHKFHGPTLLRKALAKSRNLSTVKILSDISIDYVIEYARKLGIVSHLEPNLSLSLGSSGISVLEMATAYSVFANQGELIEPIFITKIVDRDGSILEETERKSHRAIEATTAFLMTSLLESVVKEGTGTRVKKLGRPAAGKTGTTNNLFDAWFSGFTPEYSTVVWTGFDQEKSLGSGESGGRAAIPIWLYFMKDLLEGKPVKQFKAPKGIVFTRIDAQTGLLPAASTEKTILECFKKGTEPTMHTPQDEALFSKDGLFNKDEL